MPRKPKPKPTRGGKPGPHAKHGAGSVYQLRTGRWAGAARITLPDGTRTRVYVYAETEAEAADLLERRRMEMERGAPAALSVDATLGEYAIHWLDEIVALRSRSSTYDSYMRHLATLTATLGRTRLLDLTPAMLQSRYAALSKEGRSASYLHKMHTILKSALGQAVEWDLITRNPAARLTLPRLPKRAYTTLSPEQLRTVLTTAVARRHPLSTFWLLLATTGLRRGEALGLRWQDVDLDRGVLTVNGQLVRGQDKAMEWAETKTGKGRTVRLMVPVVDALRRHSGSQYADRLEADPPWPESPYVFLTARGEPWTDGAVNRAWGRMLGWAGVPSVRLHDLRHGVATLLMQDGVPAPVVAALLGHSSTRVTLDVYSHVSEGQGADAIRALESILLPVSGRLAGDLADIEAETQAC